MKDKKNIDKQTSNLNNADTKTKVRVKTGLILFFCLNLNYGVWILLLGSSIYDGSPCGPYGPCFERVLAHPFRVLFLLSSIVLSALLIIFLYRAEKLFLTRKYRIWKIVPDFCQILRLTLRPLMPQWFFVKNTLFLLH